MNHICAKNNRISLIWGLLLLVISLVLTVGVKTWFHVCIHEDGTEAVCFRAGQAVFFCSAIQSLIAVFLVLSGNKTVKTVLSVASSCTGVINALIPGVIFRLCMMPSMRCNAVTRPWVLACAAATVLVSLINLICSRKPVTSAGERSK